MEESEESRSSMRVISQLIANDDSRKEGDWIGELSLLQQHTRATASVCAKVFCEAFLLSRHAYNELSSSYPELKEHVRSIARRKGLLPDSGESLQFDCFLSHNWGTDAEGRDNHGRVSRVNERLCRAGLSVWFDEVQMKGDIHAQMSEGIDSSVVFVACVTRDCRLA